MTWVDAWNPLWDDFYGEFIPVPSGPLVPLQSPWRLYVRDETYRRRAQVSELIQFVAKLRMNNVDTWQLTLTAEDTIVDMLATPGWGIELRYKDHPLPVLSGPSFGYRRSFDPNTNNVQFNGFSDDLWLASRVVEQVPAQAYNFDQVFKFTADYDTQSGIAETVIKHYVNVNLGAGARAGRRLPALTIASDQARGSAVSEKGRMQQLINSLQELALTGGDIGFRLTADPVNGPVFDVYEPKDRTGLGGPDAAVVISPEFRNLLKFEYDVQGPTGNVVYEGAGIDTTVSNQPLDRRFYVHEDIASVGIWGRLEVFADERDLSNTDTATLLQRALGTLSQNGAQTSSVVNPNLEQGDAVFIDNWDIGDAVVVVIDNQPVAEKIRQVDLTIDAKGVDVALGQAAGGQSPPGPPWQMLQRRLAGRIRNLERRL